MASDDQSGFDFGRDAVELLRRLEPELEGLWREHRVSPEEADRILEASVGVLFAGGARIHDPEAWFLDSVRSRCRELVARRLEDHEGTEH